MKNPSPFIFSSSQYVCFEDTDKDECDDDDEEEDYEDLQVDSVEEVRFSFLCSYLCILLFFYQSIILQIVIVLKIIIIEIYSIINCSKHVFNFSCINSEINDLSSS